jgi:hypothetical protein
VCTWGGVFGWFYLLAFMKNTEQEKSIFDVDASMRTEDKHSRALSYSVFWKWIFREGLSFALIVHYIIVASALKFSESSHYFEDARLWAWVGVVYHFSVEVLQILKLISQNIVVKG